MTSGSLMSDASNLGRVLTAGAMMGVDWTQRHIPLAGALMMASLYNALRSSLSFLTSTFALALVSLHSLHLSNFLTHFSRECLLTLNQEALPRTTLIPSFM